MNLQVYFDRWLELCRIWEGFMILPHTPYTTQRLAYGALEILALEYILATEAVQP